MDPDTIFPALSSGEEVVDKYRHSECCNSVETIIILTHVRLLIRWKETICCLFHQSLYSAIELNSIHRINESRPSIYMFYVWLVATITSFITMIVGFSSGVIGLGVTALLFLCAALLYVLIYYLNLRYRYISLVGDFGSQTLKLERGLARQFEARLSEMMHQTKADHLSKSAGLSGSSPSSQRFLAQN